MMFNCGFTKLIDVDEIKHQTCPNYRISRRLGTAKDIAAATTATTLLTSLVALVRI
jgi:hypothetical protein